MQFQNGQVEAACLGHCSCERGPASRRFECCLRTCTQDITHARTGDIVAIAGLKDVTTGDTLCDEKAPIVLERMEFPDPVIKVGWTNELSRQCA